MEVENVSKTDIRSGVMKVAYSIAPWLVGALLFFVVNYHFYAPQFDGKSLSQGDIAQYAGMSKDIKEHREATGEDPQWTGNMFGGMPAYLIDIEYPEQYVKHAASPLIKSVASPMNMTLWAMALMMVAVVLMGVNPWIGIIAGLAYGLSTYFFLIIDAGHITKMWALVYAPPLVGAVWYALRRNVWVGATLAALFGSLELGANHPQITYYFLLACVALWVSQFVVAWREKMLKAFGLRTAVLAIAALLAVGSNVAPLWYTVEHQKYTTRGVSEASSEEDSRQERVEYNTAWSYGVAESFNLLVPNYMGSWSGDFNMEAAEILQSPNTQNALFNKAVDALTEEIAKDVPGVRRADIIAMLEAGDEGCMRDVVKPMLNEDNKAIPTFEEVYRFVEDGKPMTMKDIKSHPKYKEYIKECTEDVLDNLMSLFAESDDTDFYMNQQERSFPIDVLVFSGRSTTLLDIRHSVSNYIQNLNNDNEVLCADLNTLTLSPISQLGAVQRNVNSLKTVVTFGSLIYADWINRPNLFAFEGKKVFADYGVLIKHVVKGWEWYPLITNRSKEIYSAANPFVVPVLFESDKFYYPIDEAKEIIFVQSYSKNPADDWQEGKKDLITEIVHFDVPDGASGNQKISIEFDANNTITCKIQQFDKITLEPHDDFQNESLRKSLWPVVF